MAALLMPLQALDDRLINPQTETAHGMFGIARYGLLLADRRRNEFESWVGTAR
jgi:hypothetical protein